MTHAEWTKLSDTDRATAWNTMSRNDRDTVRDLSDLSPQLVGLEGYRVEVETTYGERRRFIVGKSTGWRPCHLEVKTRRSYGGEAAERHYRTVRRLYKATTRHEPR